MRSTRRGHSWIGILVAIFCLLSFSQVAVAHPMGNFSINHYAKIRVGQTTVELLYLIDMAEIPTYQDMRQFAFAAQPRDAGTLSYLDGQAARLQEGLTLEVDGQPVRLEAIAQDVVFADGAGGLPTMKLSLVFRGNLPASAGAHTLSYSDNNYPGRAGWKEIVATAEQANILQSTAPAVDRSNELSVYSPDSLSSPPQQLGAVVTFQTSAAATMPGNSGIASSAAASPSAGPPNTANQVPNQAMTRQGATTAGKSNAPLAPATSLFKANEALPQGTESSPAPSGAVHAQNTPRSSFTELITSQRTLGLWFLLTAALIAMGLGALHALEPGHGKTIVAAYLVGSRGTPAHAVLLGLVVTAAHTAGVYALGAVTLYASHYVVPEQLYPWLGVISGLSVTGVGVFIFLRHLTGVSGEHSHASGEPHSHWFFSMLKQPALQQSVGADSTLVAPQSSETRGPSLRELCVLGVSGGIVPCPAALVVLLSAFSLHRIGFGLFLITAFSVGLAAVLVLVGLTMVYAKRWVAPRVKTQGSLVGRLPLLSSSLMALLGIGIAASSFMSAPIGRSIFSGDKLVPFVAVSLLGLFLGMRHSTDPDHVVAVTTIVSRQKSIRSSATIGLLWGLGHTLTIFLVGSAIIIFGVVIPPRLGLSMEFTVALMLILLGVLNLTGILQWLNERWTPGSGATPSQREANRIGDTPVATVRSLGLYQTLRPLFVGLVHGLAGSAAVALLVLSTIKNPFWSTAYLLVFGFGTMLGMMLMTAAISAPLVLAGRRFAAINRHLTALSGLASVAFGMFLVYHIGFVDGLFTAHVHWIPN
jgi:ABC-type nickel/cobalt efflux system permease component RcnA